MGTRYRFRPTGETYELRYGRGVTLHLRHAANDALSIDIPRDLLPGEREHWLQAFLDGVRPEPPPDWTLSSWFDAVSDAP